MNAQDKPLVTRLNSPRCAVAIVALLVGLFIVGRLHLAGGDLSSFVVAGDQFSDPKHVPEGLSVLPRSAGYDGQFYYRLALNPFASQPTEFGITFDSPAFRQQRILYPLLSWAVSGGSPKLLPASMVLLNFAALCALAWIAASYAKAFNAHALWGVFVPLHPAFLFTLSRNLVEILEVTLLLASFWLLRRGKGLLASGALSLAVFTKETGLVVAVAAFLVCASQVWRRESDSKISWHYWGIPVALFVLWRAVLSYNWGSFGAFTSGNNLLGLPFVGAGSFLLEMASLETSFHRRMFIDLMFVIGFASAVCVSLRSSRATALEKLSCVGYAALAACLTRVVWIEDWGFFRALAQFSALGTIVIIAADQKVRATALAVSGAFWVYIAVYLIGHCA